jgi:multiple sugar transport system permease protein
MKRKLRILLRYLAALLVALSILAPMTWLFLMSVSATADLTRVPLEWLPRQWDFSRYARLLSLQPGEPGALFLPALRNSLLVAAGATLVSLLLAVPAAFSFSRYPGRDGWLYAGLGIYMVPPVAFVLPLYFILEHFGLLNTRSGLVLVYCSLIMPFLTWMVKNQFDALPQDIEQAARLDGLRVWQVLLRITLPWQNRCWGVGAVRLAAGLGRVFLCAAVYQQHYRPDAAGHHCRIHRRARHRRWTGGGGRYPRLGPAAVYRHLVTKNVGQRSHSRWK